MIYSLEMVWCLFELKRKEGGGELKYNIDFWFTRDWRCTSKSIFDINSQVTIVWNTRETGNMYSNMSKNDNEILPNIGLKIVLFIFSVIKFYLHPAQKYVQLYECQIIIKLSEARLSISIIAQTIISSWQARHNIIF